MSIMHVNLPDDAKAVGELRASFTKRELCQDIYQVELPGSIFVHVGWLPEFDRKGSYLVSVFRDTLENQLQNVIRTKNIHQVKDAVEAAVIRFSHFFATDSSRPSHLASSSSSTQVKTIKAVHVGAA